ncbi:MAG: hypothetical protein J6P84_03610 [Alphaproteobacteria bacterium]|nr:hypothetical protein [Clostridia bacterium]MBO6056041.1 hypothetical protein [Alphaproteobacteria bacterium]
MGYFDLPRGELELLIERDREKKWHSVCFTDSLDAETLVLCVEDVRKGDKVLDARFNGVCVKIPKKYHWVIDCKGEILGEYKTRKDAYNEWNRRRAEKRRDSTVKTGAIKLVLE